MPACANWEDERQYAWQDPDRRKAQGNLCTAFGCDYGCGTGCATCKNSQNEIFNGTGVQRLPGTGRHIRPHRYKESRDASGDPAFRLRSHVPHRLPLTWHGHLGPCHRDSDGTETNFGVDICTCERTDCKAPVSGNFSTRLLAEDNVFYGNLWPVTSENRTMLCNARTEAIDIPQVAEDPPGMPRVRDEPFEIRLSSEWPYMRRIAMVRTGHSTCTSNMAVACWGYRAPNHHGIAADHVCLSDQELVERNARIGVSYYIDGVDQGAGNETAHDFWDWLTVTAVTARFKTPSVETPYVDAAVVDAKNAALAFVDEDVRGANVLGLRRLMSWRALRPDLLGSNNGALPVFFAEYNSLRTAPWPTLHAVTTFPLTHLRHRRATLRNVEYVIVDARLDFDLILHRWRDRVDPRLQPHVFPNVDVVRPIIRAKLLLNMGVRTGGLAAPVELRGVSAAVVDRPNFYPRVTPSGADEIVYRDALGRWLVPPPVIEVDFDYGPFGASDWNPVSNVNVLSPGQNNPQRCLTWAIRMKNIVPLCERTNQNHLDACQVFDTTTGLRFRVKEFA